MSKFNLTKFLVENKLTQLGKLTNLGEGLEDKHYTDILKNYGFDIENGTIHFQNSEPIFMYSERIAADGVKELVFKLPSKDSLEYGYQAMELGKTMRTAPYIFKLDSFGKRQLITFLEKVSSILINLEDLSSPSKEDLYGDVTVSSGESDYLQEGDGYMDSEYASTEEMSKKGMYEEESEVEEDYSKYGSVEELMKEIETSTNEAAMKHKMERVKKAYESLESKATSLEEGEHASYIAPTKIKEMKRSAKKLRMMHERLVKEYDKKYASKKKVELKESLDENEGVKKPLAQLTFADVVAAFPSIGQMSTTGFKTRVGVNFPNADDSENVVYREQDFENWKAGLMSKVPDATIELNSLANKVIVHGDEYAAKRDSYIASKQLSMDRMFKRK